MTAGIDRKLYATIEQLSAAQKKSLLGFIKTIVPAIEEDVSFSVAQYNKDLDEADAAIERGEYVTNDEVFTTINNVISGRK